MKALGLGSVLAVVLGYCNSCSAQNVFEPSSYYFDHGHQRFEPRSNMFSPHFGNGPGDSSLGGFSDYLNRLQGIRRTYADVQSVQQPVFQWIYDPWQGWVVIRVR